MGHRRRQAARHPRARLRRPRRRGGRRRADAGGGDLRLGQRAARVRRLRRQALHVDVRQPAREPGPERDPALLLRQRSWTTSRRPRSASATRPAASAPATGSWRRPWTAPTARTATTRASPPYDDGGPGLLEVHLFDALGDTSTAPTTPRLVFHEVTHGLSERLVTDAGLRGAQQRPGRGDRRGDERLLRARLPRREGAQADSNVRFGEYLGPWMRDWPIDGDQLGYGALTDEPHTDGELWAQTLWSLRTRSWSTPATLTSAASIPGSGRRASS